MRRSTASGLRGSVWKIAVVASPMSGTCDEAVRGQHTQSAYYCPPQAIHIVSQRDRVHRHAFAPRAREGCEGLRQTHTSWAGVLRANVHLAPVCCTPKRFPPHHVPWGLLTSRYLNCGVKPAQDIWWTTNCRALEESSHARPHREHKLTPRAELTPRAATDVPKLQTSANASRYI